MTAINFKQQRSELPGHINEFVSQPPRGELSDHDHPGTIAYALPCNLYLLIDYEE